MQTTVSMFLMKFYVGAYVGILSTRGSLESQVKYVLQHLIKKFQHFLNVFFAALPPQVCGGTALIRPS